MGLEPSGLHQTRARVVQGDVRPDGRPRTTSRSVRSLVDPGSIAYSAVTQPLPLPRIHGGTFSSTDAVHSTRVRPIEINTDPAANSV